MQDYKREEYKVFELFDKKWALVTAGNIQHYNCCTVSWGSLGNIWGTAGNSRSTVTVYVHPARYTSEVLKESDIFTVSFYPETSRKALGYLGSILNAGALPRVQKNALFPAAKVPFWKYFSEIPVRFFPETFFSPAYGAWNPT